MSQKVAIGLDIGGTFIKSALVSEKGEILKKEITPTQTNEGSQTIIQTILTSIYLLLKELKSNQELSGIGIAVPGNVNRKEGSVRGIYNIPDLEGIPLLKEIKKEFSYPLFIDNDANNATKGEFLFGAGKGYDHLVALTLGTGIGGGIILNRRVFHGVTDYAGEIGHVTLFPDGMLCSCGNQGCFEAYASATAMINYAKQAVKREFVTRLQTFPIDKINGQVICQLANEGDAVCQDILITVGRYIALAISNIINFLNIPLIVIGGGISEGGELLFQSINENVNKFVLPKLRDTFQVKKAELGNDAGVIGSVSTVFMEGEIEY